MWSGLSLQLGRLTFFQDCGESVSSRVTHRELSQGAVVSWEEVNGVKVVNFAIQD